MVAGKFKSRTFKRSTVRTPGGVLKRVFTLGRPKKAHCANCSKELAGVARARPNKLRKINKSQRRPERPQGGKLCSGCTRNIMKEKGRSL